MIQQTSIQSFQELTISKKQMVYKAICSLLLQYKNGLTDTEICGFFSKKGELMKPRTRRNELMKMDIVYSDTKRNCSITNRVVKVWKIHKKNYLWGCLNVR